MPDRIPVTVAGASGRMGQALFALLQDHPTLRLGACLERPGHPWLQGRAPDGIGGAILTDALPEALAIAPVVLDFTAPQVSIDIARAASACAAVHVIGTTGFDAAALEDLATAGAGAVTVRAGNMSMGVNLLVQLTRRVAAALGPEFDIEIVESHHRNKRDSPSGTALMLGEAAAAGRGVDIGHAAERARDGLCGPRGAGAIGFAVVRGGDIVGEHDVVFAGEGERLILRHVATDRTVFARGALKAAEWALQRPPGEYDMLDVLGI